MRHWARADLLALLGLIAAILIAAIPPARQWLRRRWRSFLLRCGFPYRHYREWFIKTYRVTYNVYLDRREDIDLGATYVALSLHQQQKRESADHRLIATEVISDRRVRRMLVLGDPGSGKSTLLKAYGVGTLRARHLLESADMRAILKSKDVPFYVPLRRFAKQFDKVGGRLSEYLISEILVRQAELDPITATTFFRRLLEKDRCLILLDGLDEVTTDRYRDVQEAIYSFAEDRSRDMPSARARMILTCRRQNFLPIQDEWMPAYAERCHVLAPFRDEEIFRYVRNRRKAFAPPQSPETFINAVRAAGILDLHRIPLILAMSVGLFLSRRTEEVPSSVSLLYRAMITELLGRHNFPIDPVARANQFTVRDKHRFLREFALVMAKRPDGFQDFDRTEIMSVAERLAPRLQEVPAEQVKEFVIEIINRSGLLQDVSDEGSFTFAHRSIQEYLVAEELQRDFSAGAELLLDRAADQEWRQVILFFAAADHPGLGDFLCRLAEHHLELAVHCLAGADVADEVATDLLDQLAGRLHTVAEFNSNLSAVLSANRSPRRRVRDIAALRVQEALADAAVQQNFAGFLGGDIDGVINVLNALAGTNTPKIASLVPNLSGALAEDPRAVHILWRCLTAPGIDKEPAAREIIERLLVLVMNPECFAELERQLPFEPAFMSDELRRRAYPFEQGRPRDSNLVTLLSWAEHLSVLPPEESRNRFLQARAAGADVLAGIEKALRRTISFGLFWPTRVITTLAPITALIIFGAILWRDPGALIRPYGWWTPAVLLFPGLAAFCLFWVIAEADLAVFRRLNQLGFDDAIIGKRVGHFVGILDNSQRVAAIVPTWLLILTPIIYCLITAPLAVHAPIWTLGLSFILQFLFWWTPLTKFCAADRKYYLYRPNQFVDVYQDPASRHWLAWSTEQAADSRLEPLRG